MSPKVKWAATTRRQHPEDIEVSRIQELIVFLGGKYYTLGTRRSRGRQCPTCFAFVPSTDHGTRQTEGLPDLLGFLPVSRIAADVGPTFVAIEAKAPRGRLRTEQSEFRAWCLAAGVAHVAGTYDAFVAWCITRRYLRADQVAHYRVPAASGAV